MLFRSRQSDIDCIALYTKTSARQFYIIAYVLRAYQLLEIDKNLSQSLIVHLAKLKPDRVIFRDSCFANSAAKINLHQLFKHYAPNTKVDIL